MMPDGFPVTDHLPQSRACLADAPETPPLVAERGAA
jgi:hypothetical protein